MRLKFIALLLMPVWLGQGCPGVKQSWDQALDAMFSAALRREAGTSPLPVPGSPFPVPRSPTAEQGQGLTNPPKPASGDLKPAPIEVVAENLQIPWEIAVLPTGDLLVTERPGTLRRIGKDHSLITIEGVHHVGEGGLLGLALHPKFAQNQLLYLYLTTKDAGRLKNRVERYRLEDQRLIDRKLILDNIPGAVFHDGGRLAFGPDGMLYITTGDAGNERAAQDKTSLAGKLLRLQDDGTIPKDNPFKNAVYSYGHRNSQGLAWDRRGRLWSTEHGPSGARTGFDELNLIEKAKNYGWPLIEGNQRRPGMETPIIQSGAKETWAPAGAIAYDGSVFFTGLRGETLYEAKLEGSRVTSLLRHLEKKYGRLRAITLGGDGWLYVSTSNTDGRGNPRPGDDIILKIDPRMFRER